MRLSLNIHMREQSRIGEGDLDTDLALQFLINFRRSVMNLPGWNGNRQHSRMRTCVWFSYTRFHLLFLVSGGLFIYPVFVLNLVAIVRQ